MEPQKGGAGKYCGKYSKFFPHFSSDEQFQVNSFRFRTSAMRWSGGRACSNFRMLAIMQPRVQTRYRDYTFTPPRLDVKAKMMMSRSPFPFFQVRTNYSFQVKQWQGYICLLRHWFCKSGIQNMWVLRLHAFAATKNACEGKSNIFPALNLWESKRLQRDVNIIGAPKRWKIWIKLGEQKYRNHNLNKASLTYPLQADVTWKTASLHAVS